MRRLVLSRGFWLGAGALALAAIIVSGWLLQPSTVIGPPLPAPPRADYYLRDAEVDVMDENGKLSYRLKTSELLRFNDRSSKLSDVQIEYLGGKDGIWNLEAGQALITDGQKNIVLSGGVKMHSRAQRGTMQLSTRSLQVDLDGERMMTNDPITIEHPEFQTRAVGMQAGFKNRNLTLMNDVRSRYAP